jgi:hypothetical protein
MESSPTPVNGSAYWEYENDVWLSTASSSAGYFSVQVLTTGTSPGYAYAEYTYVFEFNRESVSLSFTGWGETGGGGWEAMAGFSFYDIISGFEIDSHLWRA